MRYFIRFSYDGSCFHGFERQIGYKTVQGVLEELLTLLNRGRFVPVVASGRTDVGVHAKDQCAHFDLDISITLFGVQSYLNRRLNGEVYIYQVEEVPLSFHARYDVKFKTYTYYLSMDEYNPMERNYVYQYGKTLDVMKIKMSLPFLCGTHDFRSFCFRAKEKENCVRTVFSATVQLNGNFLIFKFTGNGFLPRMVRNFVGCLIEIGEGKKDVSYLSYLIDSKGKLHVKKSAPPEGLYLTKVSYEE